VRAGLGARAAPLPSPGGRPPQPAAEHEACRTPAVRAQSRAAITRRFARAASAQEKSRHSPRVALVGVADVVAVRVAMGARKAEGEDAALQVAAELAFHVLRHRPVVVAPARLDEPGLEVLLGGSLVQWGLSLSGGCDSNGV